MLDDPVHPVSNVESSCGKRTETCHWNWTRIQAQNSAKCPLFDVALRMMNCEYQSAGGHLIGIPSRVSHWRRRCLIEFKKCAIKSGALPNHRPRCRELNVACR